MQPVVAAAPRVFRGVSDRRAAVNAMTRDVKLLLAIGGLALVAGLGWVVLGPNPAPYPAVLGYADGGPPPAPRPTPLPRPPFKMPWWK